MNRQMKEIVIAGLIFFVVSASLMMPSFSECLIYPNALQTINKIVYFPDKGLEKGIRNR